MGKRKKNTEKLFTGLEVPIPPPFVTRKIRFRDLSVPLRALVFIAFIDLTMFLLYIIALVAYAIKTY